MSVIASVVTVPDRCEDFLSILENLTHSHVLPDKLYISIAKYYPRLQKEYSSEDLISIQRMLENYPIETHIVEYEEDLGPCLKLITPVRMGIQEGDSVIIFDDDAGLFPTATQSLLRCKEKHGNLSAYGIMGTKEARWVHGEFVHEDYLEVDILGGFRGVLYPYETLVNFEDWITRLLSEYRNFKSIPFNDDHIFSYYLASHGFSRKVVNVFPKDSPDGHANYWMSFEEEVIRGYINYAPRSNSNGITVDSSTSICSQIFDRIKPSMGA